MQISSKVLSVHPVKFTNLINFPDSCRERSQRHRRLDKIRNRRHRDAHVPICLIQKEWRFIGSRHGMTISQILSHAKLQRNMELSKRTRDWISMSE